MDQEIEVSLKHGLFWGVSHIEDDRGSYIADGHYIYQPERFSNTFFELFGKLRQLNDYCFHQLVSSETKISELLEQRNAALRNTDCDAALLDTLSDDVPLWRSNVSVVSVAVPIVLLSSFVEWGLKLVIADLCDSLPRKPNPSMSDFQFLLQHLQANGGVVLSIDKEQIETVNSFRRVRNAFAHGQWDTLEPLLKTLSLRKCFSTVSSIFQEIEESAWLSPWATKDA